MGKKLFDFFGALLLLLLTAPLFPAIAIWIKATSPGPIIFRQSRLGYRRTPFTILKFRTLVDRSGKSLDWVLPGDPRVTRAGRFLRKTHMDELPQLINVLFGQMSLVGPRPFPIETAKQFIREEPSFGQRFKVLPGITGLEQIQGRKRLIKRGNRRVPRLERFYINHHCMWLDLRILFRTIETVLKCQGV
jgi:lipopolysaccharide/colanic/teichoic acid biosynthesis glycosyltransferase